MEIKETKFEYGKKNHYTKLLIGFVIACALFVALIGYGAYWAFYDMNRLPTGEYLTQATSPDGKYTVKAYVTNGGATTSYAVRGELVFNEKGYKTKNIYWNYREETASIQWLGNDKVMINGHTLNVPKEKFDFRHQ
ncbi:DUF5412 domain-containing protein [Lysinibacillus telephonicus]|uniref:DUF5412 domain-containing protein n=1 Tax=Lysinibacillus telephonicus TaxID=1714840 RepID=A0A3S0HG41_9BACI|nr:DUF5412 domain-containing protein [Lysinibacillus telephonicus]RTQ90828.1 hypothetical protein EKG35_14240 [Lysinibacillus telephonicus]